MAKEDAVRVSGKIRENLPDCHFRVELDNGMVVLTHLAGKMRRFGRRMYPGDSVEVELSPYDMERGRIVQWQGN